MTKQAREKFQAYIRTMIHFTNGYYYVGDQPATTTGRYESEQAALDYHMHCADRAYRNGEAHAYVFPGSEE